MLERVRQATFGEQVSDKGAVQNSEVKSNYVPVILD
jgi:hypothetical protein